MAFNFNWSPLIADTTRVREMLTAALNKSPKPPIIVDDIIVSEMNLGSTPPELEILEIGDLAEDRFRGIFKMSYAGDAFLTLETRVQANPLNTYLSTKPSFASPQPLAASSSLTIPLQITLSDIRLSGFVILVFSRQKGLTIVFRNDPLESLKVSSTFDSIPFIRDYLQKEIERQLRNLFMEDLPAILHRLSLRLWSSDYQELDETAEKPDDVVPVDPLASPALDPVDAFGNHIDERDLAFSLSDPTEIPATFSAKNLLRLAALTESQRTLSLFTPTLRDTVYRAWAGAAERGDGTGVNTPLTLSSLSRVNSSTALGSFKSDASSIADSSDSGTISSRPSMHSYNSSLSGINLGGNRPRTTQTRKRKNRVINLRKDRTGPIVAEGSSTPPVLTPSETFAPIPEEPFDDLVTPPRSPQKGPHYRHNLHVESGPGPLLRERISTETLAPLPHADSTPRPKSPRGSVQQQSAQQPSRVASPPMVAPIATSIPQLQHPLPSLHSPTSAIPLLRSYSLDKLASQSGYTGFSPSPPPQMHSHTYGYSQSHPLHPSSPTGFESLMSGSGGILEQAWMTKMAREIARRVREETRRAEEKAEEARNERLRATAPVHPPTPRPIKLEPAAPLKNANLDPAAGFWERAAELMGEAPPAYAA